MCLVKSGPWPVAVNKVLLAHNCTVHYNCLWLLLCYSDRVEKVPLASALQSLN